MAEDVSEGVDAFINKRQAVWKGRWNKKDDTHRQLDEAVAAAYGFPADLPDDDILAKLLEMNLARWTHLQIKVHKESQYNK